MMGGMPPKIELGADQIKTALQRHNGHVGEAAKDLGVSRAKLTRSIAHYNLQEFGASLRAAAGLKGPRASLPLGRLDPVAEEQLIREKLTAAMDREDWTPASAVIVVAASMGIDERALYKLMERYKIEPPRESEEQRQRRKRQLVAALAEANFTQVGAAKLLKVSHTSVGRWMAELGIDSSILRRPRRS